jgi:eukaryotic-like serine/threonine-protein kinase
MPEWTAEQIAQRAFDLDLIDEKQLRELWGEIGTGIAEVEQFKQTLQGRGLLTNFQLKRLLHGERHGYFYGPYKVLYKVGSGTFARVYRAVHRENGQVRALKVLRVEHQHEPEKRQQFIQEGEMGCTLIHPNIVRIYEAVSDAHASYFVMDFIEGRNLREFLKSRRMEPGEAIRLCIDICRGLDYAFKRGISHRDLKASNVLVSSLGQAKLLDFGLAGIDPNSSDAELANVSNDRTIDYAALERTTGVRKDDQRSDIFFLGCILYHMLSGKPALEEVPDRRTRMGRQRFEDMKPILSVAPDLQLDLASIVNRATLLDPEKRYQSPGEMLAELLVAGDRLSGGNGKIKNFASAAKQRAVMIVEPNAQIQDALRVQFKDKGFRVLVTADPQRPASLFTDENQPADCVIFSTSTLGEDALEAFNEFGSGTATQQVPAILLLGSRHHAWTNRAQTNDRRATVTTPIKMKRLLELFDRLMPAAQKT